MHLKVLQKIELRCPRCEILWVSRELPGNQVDNRLDLTIPVRRELSWTVNSRPVARPLKDRNLVIAAIGQMVERDVPILMVQP